MINLNLSVRRWLFLDGGKAASMYYTAIGYGLAFLVLLIIATILRQIVEGFPEQRDKAHGHRNDSPYTAASALLSNAELSFFGVLREAVGSEYHLFAKVRLADIVNVQPTLSGKHYYRAFNRISAKHVDFVVCHPRTFRIIGVIELDDSSHRSSKCQQRDDVKNRALAAASIPILRVSVRRGYSRADLRQQVNAAFG